MRFPLRFVLILAALVAAAFLVLAVACGDDEDEEAPTASPTVAAEETPEVPPAGEETPADEGTPAGEVGELPSIPAYPGATDVFSGTFTGAEAFPIPLVGDVPIEPGEFADVRYSVYQTSDSPEKVLDFYKEEFKGWKEEWTFGMEQLGQQGEIVVWSKDDRDVAAWMAAFEEEGTTSVIVAIGGRQ